MESFILQINKFLFNGNFTDVATNHKLVKTEVLKKLDLRFKGFNSDFEIASKLLKYKFKCDEIPIKYFPRRYDEGKKLIKLTA